ncbi:TIGR00730 family Rossman fold protein [Acuticoccus sediminis]|uniref:Cytokinin riboside 5'-monophosphate phosphoribohydrolase n=1 Tax=Acuticoccus sediminis TaxID=2184697 RepID=A0A8B2NQ42_9HYPH|nr:TIGR00730 family Rossman fold protein [Acuticoccus sediminis]RAI00118.1 TIGR00730 family Rossman fold protein [Acuticoccus sediminis]
MQGMNSVCVYCGSATGHDPRFAAAADELGTALARASITLVYGGGSLGLMGRIAHRVLQEGGRVIGIIPRFLHDREVMLTEVTELIVTEDMHERKRLMFEHADGFVALPGGIGTLEEVVEMMTWSQLGRHEKPIVLANVADFWAPLNALIQHMVQAGFIRPGWDVSYDVVDTISEVVPVLVERHDALVRERTPEQAMLRRL